MKKILIIDDNDLNRKLCKDTLASSGYQAIEARSGAEGVELAKNEKPDLILMDIQMPGMDGLAARKKILEIPGLEKVPVIAFTAYAMRGDREGFLSKGFAAHVEKPLNISEFLETISKFT